MKLSIVILNYNVRHFLELCLKSVVKAIEGIDAEIIVVDNQSSDDSCAMVKSLFPDVVLIENGENFGFSKGNNIGVEHAKGEYICILNPDTVVAEDTFSSILNYTESIEDAGIIGCRLVDGKGKYLPESKRNVPLVSVALKKMIGNANDYYANHLQQYDTGKADIMVGAFMLIKKDVFKDIKGFDTDYFMYGEDIDISYKAVKAGYSNYYFGKTSVIHFKGESTLKDKTYARRFFGAMQLFYKKHFKKNIVFDSIVWSGIKLAYIIRKHPKEILSNPDQYILVSDSLNTSLESKLKKPIQIKSTLDKVENNTEVIFDANYLSYKDIIGFMSNPDINREATFKILPNTSNFILGSNDSKNRGEIITF
ncbi:glycosyltransferase [Winogradskyella sp. 3972H.M.0a.05]|uniref:glycosyltransferase family 2 protein n=1 Tax=Winogradskyella sp. 3972H.M.0a.05 TaxID=2950277 RepID=UPI003393C58C